MMEVIINILYEADKIIAEQANANMDSLAQLKTINLELAQIDELLQRRERL